MKPISLPYLPFYSIPINRMFKISFACRHQNLNRGSFRLQGIIPVLKTDDYSKWKTHPFFTHLKQLFNGFAAAKSFRFGKGISGFHVHIRNSEAKGRSYVGHQMPFFFKIREILYENHFPTTMDAIFTMLSFK
jgi:hypothetical protein